MAKKVTLDNLGKEIEKILDDYAGEVQSNLDSITKEIGRKGAQALKNESSANFTHHKGHVDYAKGWAYEVEQNRLYTRVIIHNKKAPGLPHLLEFGHAKVGGGRVPGKVHIQPVESELVSDYEREVISKL